LATDEIKYVSFEEDLAKVHSVLVKSINNKVILLLRGEKMLTDTIQVSGLSEAVVEAVNERAKEVGVAAEEYVRFLIEEDIASPLNARVLYAPVREQIKASGISDEDLDVLLEEAREEVFRENRQ